MRRREFIAALPCAAMAQPAAPSSTLNATAEILFLDLIRGYVLNLAQTSDSYAVVEYPAATVTKNFLSKSGKSATGVTRMLPAIAAWVAAKRQPGVLSIDGKKFDLLDVAGSALANGTNPDHKDYWLPARKDEQDQRQVESSLIAWSIWLLRDTLLPQMSSLERRRVDEWLASCTVVPVRGNNWAWFTAVNAAARMALKEKFDEFSFNQSEMFEDLKALNAMHAGSGWYNDDKSGQAFDYYNSWVFASHFLYWNAMVGERFPDWSKLFGDRLRQYMETAPLFFGSNGSHILYGRSLIYRWAVLTPMVLAYGQKLWPHDPGTLHRIARGNLEFHVKNGGFDRDNGKLRETFSSEGTVDIRESYIDGGHPYWGMQAFAMFLIPRDDPFWSASGGTLPVEKSDFLRPIDSPGLILTGHKASGQVKLLQARSTKTDPHYRDKYDKFVYSSHFPMNIVQRDDICPWDNAFVLRDRRTRRSFGRSGFEVTRLLPNGFEASYMIVYKALKVAVRSTLIAEGEFELRLHRVIAPPEFDLPVEIVEGSSALGVEDPGDVDHAAADAYSIARNRRTGMLIGSWRGTTWTGIGAAWDFGSSDSAESNIVYPHMEVNTLWVNLKPGAQVVYSVHYASPKPLAHAALHATAAKLLLRGRGMAGGAVPSNSKPRPG